MSNDIAHAAQVPFWTVTPNDTDWLAWSAIITIGLAVYFIMYVYASFDQWAEHKAVGTIFAKTIPTLLAMALLYEIFPLDHFSILLPLTAILIAVMADWMAAQAKDETAAVDLVGSGGVEPEPEQTNDMGDQTEDKPAARDQKSAVSVGLKPKQAPDV